MRPYSAPAALFALRCGVLLDDMSDVTRILSAVEQGDPSAAAELLPLVYDELRRLAAASLAAEPAALDAFFTQAPHFGDARFVAAARPG